MQNTLFVVSGIRVRSGMGCFKTTALIDSDVDKHGTVRDQVQHIARDQFRSRSTDNQDRTDHKIGVRYGFFDRILRRSESLDL